MSGLATGAWFATDALALPVNVADEASVASLVEDVVAQCGRIDILINNGGVSQRALAQDASLAVEPGASDTKAAMPLLNFASRAAPALTAVATGEPLRSKVPSAKKRKAQAIVAMMIVVSMSQQ